MINILLARDFSFYNSDRKILAHDPKKFITLSISNTGNVPDLVLDLPIVLFF